MFAVYSLVFLWAGNTSEGVQPSEVLGLIGIVVAGALAVYVMFRLLLGEAMRAGLCTTVVVLLVLSFGHLAGALRVGPGTKEEGVLLLAYVLLLGSGLVMAIRVDIRTSGATRILNLVSVALVALNVVPVARAADIATPDTTAGDDIVIPRLSWQADGPPRDIYYLVFDRYANGEVLRDMYGFDNEPTLAFLESQGFTVEREAVANYPQTAHSLASTLNMVYLDGLAQRVGVDSGDWTPIDGSLARSEVAMALKDAGYTYVMIGSWWPPTAQDPFADVNYAYGRPLSFTETYYQTTAIPYAVRWVTGGDGSDRFEAQFERVGYQVEALMDVRMDPRPTFTFVHFTLPHFPFVFDAQGNYKPPEDAGPPDLAYLEQLRYTNLLIEDVVTGLLTGSDEDDPIVVVQSDEGPNPPDRDDMVSQFAWAEEPSAEIERKLRILHAYHFPGLDRREPLPTRTPVNTFRALLDAYFGAGLPLLPDRVFVWEDRQHPYRFTDVTERFFSSPVSG